MVLSGGRLRLVICDSIREALAKPRLTYRAIFLAVGCSLFAYLLVRLGPGKIFTTLRGIGWGFLGIAVAYVGHQLLRAIALRQCITSDERTLYWDLVRIRLSGEAVQFLTFTGPFLAEPTKALLLRTRGLTIAHAFAATISEYLMYTSTSAIMAIAGLLYLLQHFELSRPITLAARIVVCIAGTFLLVAADAVIRRTYLIGAVVGRISRLPIIGKYVRVDKKVLHATEDLLFVILRSRPWRFLSIVAVESAAQMLLVVELFVLLRVTGDRFSVTHPFLIESATKFIGLGFFFIPGQIGASEGSYMVIFEAIGLPPPIGFSLAVARRLRSLIVAGTGLLFLPR
jgi:hypothetical protein